MNSTLVLRNSGNRKWWSRVLTVMLYSCNRPLSILKMTLWWYQHFENPLRTKLWATLSSELRIELFPSHCFCSTSQTLTLSPLTIRESVRPVSDDNILSSLRETSVLGAVPVMQSTRLSAPHSSVPDCLYLPDGSEVSSQNVLCSVRWQVKQVKVSSSNDTNNHFTFSLSGVLMVQSSLLTDAQIQYITLWCTLLLMLINYSAW